jgi:hypothetical protein
MEAALQVTQVGGEDTHRTTTPGSPGNLGHCTELSLSLSKDSVEGDINNHLPSAGEGDVLWKRSGREMVGSGFEV